MSDAESSPVILFDNSGPEMRRAYEAARASFRYLGREIARDRRRIVPALAFAFACAKAPFSDGDARDRSACSPEVEQMWLIDVDFDGVLGNAPNWLTTVRAGDAARFGVGAISDSMYAIGGEAYGGHTINLLRSRLGAAERAEHAAAWDLNFGDPLRVRVAPEADDGTPQANLAMSLRGHLAQNPAPVAATGHHGWALLHQEASAGSLELVQALLAAGADPAAVTDTGLTAAQIADDRLGWDEVAAVLDQHQA